MDVLGDRELYDELTNSLASIYVIRIVANDPRTFPTEQILVTGPADDLSVADLDELVRALREENEWSVGYIEDLCKSGGYIGADAATIFSLALGVVGVIPVVQSLYSRLGRPVPPRPDRDKALDSALWAIAMQYPMAVRRSLQVYGETREKDHWVFQLKSSEGSDLFEVVVYGSRSEGAVAVRTTWSDGTGSI